MDSSDDEQSVPLVVDLDGTLIRSDLLYESFFGACTANGRSVPAALGAVREGRAALKSALGSLCTIEFSTLPYNDDVLALIKRERLAGVPIYLATAADERHAHGVADYLGLFEGVFASNGKINLSASRKAKLLVEQFGERGFDYIGNDIPDLEVWAHARKAYGVDLPRHVSRKLSATGMPFETVSRQAPSLKVWTKALRVHQYSKNLLVFVPLMTSQTADLLSIGLAAVAFLAFCACASSVYLLNDLLDLPADRRHASKCRRPFASGLIPVGHAPRAFALLLMAAGLLASLVGPSFVAVLGCYFGLTLAYSFYLKRRMLIDVIALSLLYTLRIFGGATAIDVAVSHWLLGFSLFIFTSLALLKRYVELAGRLDRALPDPTDRNYRISDLDIVAALAAATGANAVLVLSLYVADPEVRSHYTRPDFLWLMCPLLLYWISRALMMAHRRTMDDDPIVFAITDRNSRLAIACIVLITLAAF